MKIHLYAVRLQRALRAEETETLMKLLPPERRARLERLSRPELAGEPLCAYAALRAALRELYGWASLPPMTCGRWGKPGFPDYPDVCFNLSHTSGAVLVGIHDQPIGVDIEKLRPVSERMLRRVGGAAMEREFFERWVRGESRCKRSGFGLAGSHTAAAPAPENERFWYPAVFAGYAACVCTCSDAELAPLRRFVLE